MAHNPSDKRDTRAELQASAIRLGARDGLHAASIRVIARDAGVTEGAVYKHFANKDDLIREAYKSIVSEMVRAKEDLFNTEVSFEAAIREWVRLTYEYYDGNRDAFTYVLLMPHSMAETLGDIYRAQGELFREFIIQAQGKGKMTMASSQILLTIASGAMLNVPRMINDAVIDGPAVQYTDEATALILRIFAVE
jgi:AcrR family transcriptional regulator